MTTDFENTGQDIAEEDVPMTDAERHAYNIKHGRQTDDRLHRKELADGAHTGHLHTSGFITNGPNKDALAAASMSGANQLRAMVRQVMDTMDEINECRTSYTAETYRGYINTSRASLNQRTVEENRREHAAARANMSDEERLATVQEAAQYELDNTMHGQGGIVDQNTDKIDNAVAENTEIYDAELAAQTARIEAEQAAQAEIDQTRTRENLAVQNARSDHSRIPGAEEWTPEHEEAARREFRQENNLDLETGTPLPEGTGTVLAHGTGTQITASPVLLAGGDNDVMQKDFGPAASLEGLNPELVSANPGLSLSAPELAAGEIKIDLPSVNIGPATPTS